MSLIVAEMTSTVETSRTRVVAVVGIVTALLTQQCGEFRDLSCHFIEFVRRWSCMARESDGINGCVLCIVVVCGMVVMTGGDVVDCSRDSS